MYDSVAQAQQLDELDRWKLTSLQRASGIGLDGCGRVARLLYFRKFALEADLQCKWARSDFFWKESLRQLRALAPDSTIWSAAAECIGARTGTGEIDPRALRSALTEGLFVATFQALYRAALKAWPDKPTPDNREFVYVEYMRSVFDIAGVDSKQQAEILMPIVDRRIDILVEAKKWKAAIENATDMAKRLPAERQYQEKLMLLEFQKTMDSLSAGKLLLASDGMTLKEGIDRLEQLRRQYPAQSLAFPLIGRLRRLRAITLANTSQTAEALVESQMGMDYLPGSEDAEKTHEQLKQNMVALKQKVETVLREIKYSYNKQLSADGQRMVNDANKGFQPLNEYETSQTRAQIQKDAVNVRLKEIWLTAGYAQPTEDWDQRAERLCAVLADAFEKKPDRPEELDPLWRQLVAGDPMLSELDPQLAVNFLRERLFPEHNQAEAAAPAEANPPALPELRFEAAKRRSGEEPFVFWLFSREGIRLKLLSSAACLLLVCALSLAAFDALRSSQQDRAYAALLQASQNGNYAGVVENAENFLSHPALHDDDRTAEVKSLYAEGLVRWFSLMPKTPNEDALQRARRYRQLTASVGGH